MTTFNNYIDALKNDNIRNPLIKMEFLRQEDETPLKEIVTEIRISGTLNISNKNGVRRSLGLELDNTDQQFFPSLDNNIWVGQKARLSLGYEINGENFFIPQGVFVYDNPTINSDGSIDVNMVDKFSMLDGSIAGIIDTVLIIPISTTLGTALRTIMTISQDTKDILIDSSLDSEVIPYQILKEEGATLGETIIELAQAFSCNTYYNENGNLVFERDVDDTSKGAVWEYNADNEDEKSYQSGDIEYNFDGVKNVITVIGDNIAGQIFRATVKNEDLLSDTSIPNIGVEILEVIKDDIIYSNELCRQRCIYELRRKTNVNVSGRISSMLLPHINIDDVILVTDSRINLFKKRLLVNSISMSLSNQFDMSISVVDTFSVEI